MLLQVDSTVMTADSKLHSYTGSLIDKGSYHVVLPEHFNSPFQHKCKIE